MSNQISRLRFAAQDESVATFKIFNSIHVLVNRMCLERDRYSSYAIEVRVYETRTEDNRIDNSIEKFWPTSIRYDVEDDLIIVAFKAGTDYILGSIEHYNYGEKIAIAAIFLDDPYQCDS